jgi:hypothetical protein
MSDRRRRPIYIDGPLEGQDFPVDPDVHHVQALDYPKVGIGISSYLPGTEIPDIPIVTYQLREFAFRSGGSTVRFLIGSSAPGEPFAMTVFRALCKPELLDRAETGPATS